MCSPGVKSAVGVRGGRGAAEKDNEARDSKRTSEVIRSEKGCSPEGTREG